VNYLPADQLKSMTRVRDLIVVDVNSTLQLVFLTTFESACNRHNTHTHPFNGPFPGSTQVSRYQKGNTNLDFNEARDSEWHWHQLGHVQVCTLLQTDNHASTPPLNFFTGRMPFLPPNQQRQNTEGTQQTTDTIHRVK